MLPWTEEAGALLWAWRERERERDRQRREDEYVVRYLVSSAKLAAGDASSYRQTDRQTCMHAWPAERAPHRESITTLRPTVQYTMLSRAAAAAAALARMHAVDGWSPGQVISPETSVAAGRKKPTPQRRTTSRPALPADNHSVIIGRGGTVIARSCTGMDSSATGMGKLSGGKRAHGVRLVSITPCLPYRYPSRREQSRAEQSRAQQSRD